MRTKTSFWPILNSSPSTGGAVSVFAPRLRVGGPRSACLDSARKGEARTASQCHRTASPRDPRPARTASKGSVSREQSRREARSSTHSIAAEVERYMSVCSCRFRSGPASISTLARQPARARTTEQPNAPLPRLVLPRLLVPPLTLVRPPSSALHRSRARGWRGDEDVGR